MIDISLIVIFNIFRLLISIKNSLFRNKIRSNLSISVIFVSSNKNINFLINLNQYFLLLLFIIFVFILTSFIYKINLSKYKAMNE